MANRILRDKMRGPRKKAKEQALQDQVLLKKASLDIKLLPETEQDKKLASLLKLNSSMSSEQKESELREEIIEESIFSATTSSSPGTSNAVQSKSKSVNHLQKIVKRKREDDVSSVPAKTSNSIGVVVKKTSTPVKTSPIKLSLCSTDYGNSSSSDENE